MASEDLREVAYQAALEVVANNTRLAGRCTAAELREITDAVVAAIIARKQKDAAQ